MSKPKTIKHRLVVVVEAQDARTVADMVEALARFACDIANSTDDQEAHVSVRDATQGKQS